MLKLVALFPDMADFTRYQIAAASPPAIIAGQELATFMLFAWGVKL
jgi:hypothetical protein